MTKNGKALTARGVKPICPFQQVFQSTYLFGAFSPLDGNSFLLILPKCNNDNFQIYLDKFSLVNPKELKVIILDNGAFHKAKRLKVPENIILIYLPPYSPELNPAENMWARFKRDFTNRFFNTIRKLENYMGKQVKELTKEIVKKTCRFEYIFEGKFWSVL